MEKELMGIPISKVMEILAIYKEKSEIPSEDFVEGVKWGISYARAEFSEALDKTVRQIMRCPNG